MTARTMNPRTRRPAARRGAAMLEGALALATAMVLILGMYEVGIAVFRQCAISEAARRAARYAIVHGKQNATGALGPATLTFKGDAGTNIARAIAPVLVALDPADVQTTISWDDGDNDTDDRVTVTVTYTHKPVVPLPYAYGEHQITATSTMRIMN